MITQIKLFLQFLKANKWLVIAGIAIALVILGVYFGARLWRGEMQRMENNYLAALEQLKADNKDNMRVLQLKVDEVKNQYPEIVNELKDMKIKIKNVETIQNVNTVITNDVHTILRDSTIRDSIKVRVAVYKDQWTDFRLYEIQDSVRCIVQSKDSLFIVLNKVPRNLWQWLSAKPKVVRSTVKNYNPNSVIIYNRLIRIEK